MRKQKIEQLTYNYFWDVYMMDKEDTTHQLVHHLSQFNIPNLLDRQIYDLLISTFEAEVQTLVYQMKLNKAPRPNGLKLLTFKKFGNSQG